MVSTGRDFLDGGGAGRLNADRRLLLVGWQQEMEESALLATCNEESARYDSKYVCYVFWEFGSNRYHCRRRETARAYFITIDG